MDLGRNIKNYRILKKMTQEDLADLLGTTSKSISRWEQNITYPDITILPCIANIFEITVDELLGVEKIKVDEYIKDLRNKSYIYQKNNDIDSELTLWQEAYKKLPNNEEIKCNLITSMFTINTLSNEIKYKDEIIKLSESILDKSINNHIRLSTIQNLVYLYSQMNNLEMAEYYCKQLPNNFVLTYDVMKTRYLQKEQLLNAIQNNIVEFTNEISREIEWIIYDNRIKTSNEYKKEILERIIEIEKLIFIKNNDYGYNGITFIFNYIELMKLEIKTTNCKEKVLNYLEEINKVIDYIINFKPHKIESPFMNEINCDFIGGLSQMSLDLKNNILRQIQDSIFNEFHNSKEYIHLIENIKNIK